jgi:hypothetical protein
VAGLLICFLGSKFLFYVLRALLFFGVAGFFWLALYNLNLTSFNDSNTPHLILFGIISVVLGGAAAYFFGNFAEQYAASIIAGACGFAIAFMMLSNSKMSDDMVHLVSGIAALICAYFGRLYNKYIKSVGTALIGAFFTSQGIGYYAGGFPSFFNSFEIEGRSINLKDLDVSPKFLLYFCMIVVFTALGSFVQLKYIAPEDEEEDDMMKQEFA